MGYSLEIHSIFIKIWFIVHNEPHFYENTMNFLWISHQSHFMTHENCKITVYTCLACPRTALTHSGFHIGKLLNCFTFRRHHSEDKSWTNLFSFTYFSYFSWFPEVVNVFIDKNMLKHLSSAQVDSFYNSVSTLISNQVSYGTYSFTFNFNKEI